MPDSVEEVASPDTPEGFVQVMVCSECEAAVTEWNDPVYECGNCGGQFSRSEEGSSRCRDCGKFSAKVGDGHDGCEGIEDNAEEGFQCVKCEDVVMTTEEAIKHLETDHSNDDAPEKLGRVMLHCDERFVADDGIRITIGKPITIGSREKGTHERWLGIERRSSTGGFIRSNSNFDMNMHVQPFAARDGEWLVLTEIIPPVWRGERTPRTWRVKPVPEESKP